MSTIGEVRSAPDYRDDPEWQAAYRTYMGSRWSLFDLEVLSHHFCSSAPFEREGARAYQPCIDKLRRAGLIDEGRRVTVEGVRFIARVCSVSPAGDEAGELSVALAALTSAPAPEDRT